MNAILAPATSGSIKRTWICTDCCLSGRAANYIRGEPLSSPPDDLPSSSSAESAALQEAEQSVREWKAKATTLAKKAKAYRAKLEQLQARAAKVDEAQVEALDPESATDLEFITGTHVPGKKREHQEPPADDKPRQGETEAQLKRTRAERDRAEQERQHAQAECERAETERQHAQTECERAETELQHAQAECARAETEVQRIAADLKRAEQEAGAAMEKEARLRGTVFGALASDGGGPALFMGAADGMRQSDGPVWKTTAVVLAVLLLIVAMFELTGNGGSAPVEETWDYYPNDIPQWRTSVRGEGERHGLWQTFHENGETASSGSYEAGFKQGHWQTWLADGSITKDVRFEQGLIKHATDWWPTGEKRRSGPVLAGKPHGDWTTWHNNGEVAGKGPYVDGKRLGVWWLYDPDGEFLPARSGTYDGDSLASVDGLVARKYQGEVIRWHNNGEVSGDGNFVDGAPVGPFTDYHANEQKARVVEFREGLIEGTVRHWGEDGQLVAEQMFERGKLHGKSLEHYPNGQMKSEGQYEIGTRNGMWVTWHVNSNKESEGAYVGGSKHGPWISWYADGKKKSEATYVGGTKHGPWISRHTNGDKESEGSYDQDRKAGSWTYWFESGRVREKGDYVAGAKQEEWSEFHDTGELSARGDYWEGKRQGPWERFKANGSSDPQASGYFHEDKRLADPVDRTAWYQAGDQRFEQQSRAGRIFFESRSWPQARGEVLLSTAWNDQLATEVKLLATAKFTGGVHINWNTGKRRASGRMRLGRNEGSWQFDYPNGKTLARGAFSRGQPEGSWRMWHQNGSKLVEVNYKGGQLHGIAKRWNTAGNLVATGEYAMSLETGTWKYWYGTGEPLAEGEFDGGKQSGIWKYWSVTPSEHQVLEGAFVDGLRTGTWTRWSESKRVTLTGEFDRGARSGEFKVFALNGENVLRVQFDNDKRHGSCEFRDDKGSLILSGSYSHGEPNGIWSSWWESDKKRYRGDYLPSELPVGILESVDTDLAPLAEARPLPEVQPTWPW